MLTISDMVLTWALATRLLTLANGGLVQICDLISRICYHLASECVYHLTVFNLIVLGLFLLRSRGMVEKQLTVR